MREAFNGTGVLLNATKARLPGNGTLVQNLNATMANGTAAMANGSFVRPFDITAFSEMLDKLNNASSAGSVGPLTSPATGSRNTTGSEFAAFRLAVGSNSTTGNSTHNSTHNSTTYSLHTVGSISNSNSNSTNPSTHTSNSNSSVVTVKATSKPKTPKTGRRLLAW